MASSSQAAVSPSNHTYETVFPTMKIPRQFAKKRGRLSGAKASLTSWTLGADTPSDRTEQLRFPDRPPLSPSPKSTIYSPRSERAERDLIRQRLISRGYGSLQMGASLPVSSPLAPNDKSVLQTYSQTWSLGCDISAEDLARSRFMQKPIIGSPTGSSQRTAPHSAPVSRRGECKSLSRGDGFFGDVLDANYNRQRDMLKYIKELRGRSSWSFETMQEPIHTEYEEIDVEALGQSQLRAPDVIPEIEPQEKILQPVEQPPPLPNEEELVSITERIIEVEIAEKDEKKKKIPPLVFPELQQSAARNPLTEKVKSYADRAVLSGNRAATDVQVATRAERITARTTDIRDRQKQNTRQGSYAALRQMSHTDILATPQQVSSFRAGSRGYGTK